jgi:hypothetical protein
VQQQFARNKLNPVAYIAGFVTLHQELIVRHVVKVEKYVCTYVYTYMYTYTNDV